MSIWMMPDFLCSNFQCIIPAQNLNDWNNERGHVMIARNHMENMFEGKTVLLVEDMAVNRELAKVVLEEQKLTVDTAVNGQIAVDMFKEHPQRYAAILMDIQMPVMNGYEAAKAIRSLHIPEAQKVPIIAMTANAFVEDKLAAIESGMNSHVSKPIDVQQLNKTLSEYLGA